MASPAEVIRALMIRDGLVMYPIGRATRQNELPQCFVGMMPNEIDVAVLLADTTPRMFGRAMVGTTWKHYGIKLNLRHLASNGQAGYDVIKSISDWIDYLEVPTQVNSRGKTCHVCSLYKDADVKDIGEERGTNRRLWSMDLLLAMRTVEQTPIEE